MGEKGKGKVRLDEGKLKRGLIQSQGEKISQNGVKIPELLRF